MIVKIMTIMAILDGMLVLVGQIIGTDGKEEDGININKEVEEIDGIGDQPGVEEGMVQVLEGTTRHKSWIICTIH